MYTIDFTQKESRSADTHSYNDLLMANRLLEKRGIPLLDSVRLVLDLIDASGGAVDIKRMKRCIQLGGKTLEREEYTVTFREAFKSSLASKYYRRPRTLSDIKQMMERLMKSNPGLSKRSLRSLSSPECSQFLNRAFSTSRQLYKARLVLSGVFSLGKRRGWCDDNPVERVDVPVLRESEIPSLMLDEVKVLLHMARTEINGECLPAVLLMLFAGIRPREVQRLKWENISLKEKVVSLRPSHTKTGGARHVSILPVLAKWLNYYVRTKNPMECQGVCPRNWMKKWSHLRKCVGWGDGYSKGVWKQDCLRHTYASYHAKYFQDYAQLQVEMGHHSSSLLRTRYLNMKGITRADAKQFWNLSISL